MPKETTPKPASQPLSIAPVDNLPVLVDFEAGQLSSDAGLLLLKEVDQQLGLTQALADVLHDPRDPRYTQHSTLDLVRQRVFQIAAGYEDQNDADTLRIDPILKMVLDRRPESGAALASQPTLSRFENRPSRVELYRFAEVLVETFIASYNHEPELVVLDFDDTDDAVHGNQQLALFSAYYGGYCYQPLHVYEGTSGRLITTILKPKQLRGTQAVALLRRLVERLRRAWPQTLLLFRGDSHFAYAEVMAYIDTEPRVSYVTGIQTNATLKRLTADIVEQTRRLFRHRRQVTGRAEKVTRFHSFPYQARRWARPRRVVVKVEISALGTNVRFVVSDLDGVGAERLYRVLYCDRGRMEGFIKDHKTYLRSDRTSCVRFEANQFRLLLHSAAYVLFETLRRELLGASGYARATIETLRLVLIKVASRVRELKTRIRVSLPRSCVSAPVLRSRFAILALLRGG